MQTFLPLPSFTRSLLTLDKARLKKQVVEAKQLLTVFYKDQVKQVDRLPSWHKEYQEKIGWRFHPAYKMWKAYPFALITYFNVALLIAESKGIHFDPRKISPILDPLDWQIFLPTYRPNESDKLKALQHLSTKLFLEERKILLPRWLGHHKVHITHMSNLLRKEPQFYTRMFGIQIPTNLEYLWPDEVDFQFHFRAKATTEAKERTLKAFYTVEMTKHFEAIEAFGNSCGESSIPSFYSGVDETINYADLMVQLQGGAPII